MSYVSVDLIPVSAAPFRIGAAISKTFEILRRQFGKFFLLALIPLLPNLIVSFLAVNSIKSGGPHVGFNALGVGAFTLDLFLRPIAQATSLFGAVQVLRGQHFTISGSLSVGLRRSGPIIGVALLTGVSVGLGMLLLVVPGIIVGCMLYVAIAACVVEKLGVTASMRRSAQLTKGARWSIFGVLLVVIIASFFVLGILALLVGRASAPYLILQFAWGVLATSFGAVLSAVIYYDLRVAKEGIDIGQLANVFD